MNELDPSVQKALAQGLAGDVLVPRHDVQHRAELRRADGDRGRVPLARQRRRLRTADARADRRGDARARASARRDCPDPDLLIRTSGEMRVSNFLLWQIAYSEIWVTPTLWPDFRKRHLFEAILDFQKRERRYGGVIDEGRSPEGKAEARGRDGRRRRRETFALARRHAASSRPRSRSRSSSRSLFLAPPLVFNLLVARRRPRRALGVLPAWPRRRATRVAKTLGIVYGGLVLGAAAVLWGPFRFATRSGDGRRGRRGRSVPGGWYALAPARDRGSAASRRCSARVSPAAALSGAGVDRLRRPRRSLCPRPRLCYLRAISPRAVLLPVPASSGSATRAAYYFGRRFGAHRLAPVVSPKKTWEGAIAGLVGATLFGAAAGTLVVRAGARARARGARGGARVDGRTGRATSSSRSGSGAPASRTRATFLPGHGGFYDRIDSLLFAGPVVAAFLACASDAAPPRRSRRAAPI